MKTIINWPYWRTAVILASACVLIFALIMAWDPL